MRVTPEALEEFKALWKKEFGTEIDNITALEYATKLLSFAKICVDGYIKQKHKDTTADLSDSTVK